MYKSIIPIIALLFVNALPCMADAQPELMKCAADEFAKKFVNFNDHYYGCDYQGVLFEATKIRFSPDLVALSEVDRLNGIEWKGSIQFTVGPARYFNRTSKESGLVPTDWEQFPYAFLYVSGQRRNGKSSIAASGCPSVRKPTNVELEQIGAAAGIVIPAQPINSTADTMPKTPTSPDKTAQGEAEAATTPTVFPPRAKRGPVTSEQQSGWQRPGTTEAADADRADTEINAVYQRLMSSLDQNKQRRLRDVQRAWLKSRDTEAVRIAREGGAVGGSALRVDSLTARARLTRERTEVLRGYLKNPETIP